MGTFVIPTRQTQIGISTLVLLEHHPSNTHKDDRFKMKNSKMKLLNDIKIVNIVNFLE